MDRLRLMRSLVTVVRKKSFAAASRELGVAQGLLSKHVKQLENFLNMQILLRDTRGLTLTERGREYYEFCVQFLDNLEQAEEALTGRDQQPHGTLKILAPVCFGTLYFGQLISAFMDKYPEISVSVNLWGQNVRPSGLIEHSFDLVVRVVATSDSNLIMRKITPLQNVVCASPDYLDRFGAPNAPEDLLNHVCLYHKHAFDSRWEFEDRAGVTTSLRLPASLMPQTNSLHILRHLASEGRGVAILPDYCVHEEIVAGRLRRIMPDYEPESAALYLLFSPSSYLPLKLRLFIDFFSEYFRAPPWRQEPPKPAGRARPRGAAAQRA